MLSLENGNYTHEQVKRALTTNREISFKFELLDKTNRTLGYVSAEGSISFDSGSSIKRVGRFQIRDDREIDFLNSRIKPYMGIKLDGQYLWYPLGIFLMESPSRISNGSYVMRSVEAYDLTLILRDDKFTSNYYVPNNTPYTNVIKQIISDAGITNYSVDDSDLLTTTDLEFEVGTSRLDAINRLCEAINYNQLYVDAYGAFRVEKYVDYELRRIDETYSTDKDSVVITGASENIDLFNAPNIFVRYLENAESECIISKVVNDDPTSPLSTVNRGRSIVDVQSVDDVANASTLDAIAYKAMQTSKLYQSVNFKTALMPHHGANDCLYLINSELGTSGKFIETSWSMDLKVGGQMNHTCRKVVANV